MKVPDQVERGDFGATQYSLLPLITCIHYFLPYPILQPFKSDPTYFSSTFLISGKRTSVLYAASQSYWSHGTISEGIRQIH
jgi:hypothetical protein